MVHNIFNTDSHLSNNAISDDLYINNSHSKSYLSYLLRGLLWFCMCLFSFITLFFIFKTPYYKYYNQTDPIIVESKNPFTQNIKDSSNNINDELLFNSEMQKNNAPIITIEKEGDSNSKGSKDLGLQSNAKDQMVAPINKPAKEQSSITQLFNNQNNNGSSSVNTREKNNEVSAKPQNTQVWVINIYSTSDKSSLDFKLKELKQKYAFLNNNYGFFVNSINLNNNTMYRISVSKDYANFYKTSNEANIICNYFKANNLNCFVSTVSSSDVSPIK